MKKVSVIGAGAWGTALATSAARAGCDVTLWAMEAEVVESIDALRENTLFLAGQKLSKLIKATNNLSQAIDSDVIFLVAPSQFLRATCKDLLEAGLSTSTPLVICSKGIEQKTLKLMTEVVKDVLPNPAAILSGPTFASEVASGLPASIMLACEDAKVGKKIEDFIESQSFKVFHCTDTIGAEIGGAMKNVIAIACGISEGKGLGENAKAALITRGLKEMKCLCVAKGGNPETLMELCGVGDLILTCSSRESRNMSLGYRLGSGELFEDIMKKRHTVAEGVASAESIYALAEKLEIELPICIAVYEMVHGKADINKTIEELVKSS